MKKTFVTLISILAISITMACHIESVGYCGNSAYFVTKDFNPNSSYYMIYGTDTLAHFTTGSVAPNDSIIHVEAPVGAAVRLYYGYIGKKHSDSWFLAKVKNEVYKPACEVLAFTRLDLKVQGNTIIFNSVGNAYKYVISTSENGVDFKEVAVLKEDGKETHRIQLGAQIAALLLLPLLLTGFKRNRAWMLLIAVSLVGYSCSKERVNNESRAKVVKVDAVNQDGKVILSEVKRY